MTQVRTAVPVRTCIGCRRRVPAAELLRVVVASGATSQHDPDSPPDVPGIVPDPRCRATGRGAWVHRDVACVDTAVRRRAFARALRVPGPTDPTAVQEFVAQEDPEHQDPQYEARQYPPAEPRRR